MADKAKLLEILDRVIQDMDEQKLFLTELDNVIGDGDHGINMDRGFQAVMKVGMLFLPLPVPQTLKGEGALVKLPSVIRKRGISNVLVITDQGLMKLGLPDPLFKAFSPAATAPS